VKDPVKRLRAPLIPAISTLDSVPMISTPDSAMPAESETPASEILQKDRVVVIIVIDIGTAPPKPS
jgi:hypothetical protein